MLLLMPACDGLLSVDNPTELTQDNLEGTPPVDLAINGTIGSFQNMMDWYVLHTGLLADEFVTAGTFPYRGEIDSRSITKSNPGLVDDLYTPLAEARFMADTTASILDDATGQEEFDQDRVLEGRALAIYYAGYTRILLAEGFCESTVDAGPALPPDERMQEALNTLQEAESAAQDADRSDLVNAAQVGQARAHLWLGNLSDARSNAADIPDDFALEVNYSSSSVESGNKVARLTWGVLDAVIRWTVGNGTSGTSNEQWPYFDEWVELGLLVPRDDLSPFDPSVPVSLQQKYTSPDAAIQIASASEAKLIEAEVLLREGDLENAASIVNQLREKWDLDDLSFTGDLEQDLEIFARERARELWLTGRRIGALRRYSKDGVDLFPSEQTGSDTCFPLPQREIDANPNL